MASGMRVEVEGITSLARVLRKAGDEGSREFLLQANKDSAKIVEGAAAPLIPRRSGKLAGTLRSTGTAKGGVVLLGKLKVPYAGPLHFGWFRPRVWGRSVASRRIRPGLWLYHALDRRRDEVEETYHLRLQELLDRVVAEANRG